MRFLLGVRGLSIWYVETPVSDETGGLSSLEL